MRIRYRRHSRFPFQPDKSALLVIDLQGYFTDERSRAYVPGSEEIIPRVNGLVKAFRRKGRPVIFTRHIDVDPNTLMSRWWRATISEEDPLSELNKKLDVGDGVVLVKHQYDAFFGTGLAGILREAGVSQVVVTGVVTHICCETTARSAFMYGFETFFAIDGTTSYNIGHHKAAIYNLADAFAVPVECRELLRELLDELE